MTIAGGEIFPVFNNQAGEWGLDARTYSRRA